MEIYMTNLLVNNRVLALMTLFSLSVPAFAADAQIDRRRLSDRKIVDVVSVINQGEVNQGILAVQKGTAEEVKVYAKKMIVEHARMNFELALTLGELNISKKCSRLSRKLERRLNRILVRLSKKEGVEFDRGYIKSQIRLHKRTVRLLERVLIPNLRLEPLKQLLEKALPMIVEHQKEAVTIGHNIGVPKLEMDAIEDEAMDEASLLAELELES
jgi:putative membrane protein